MPFDPTGKATLPPSTWATSGQTIRTEQHNPPFRDIESMLSSVLVRDGRAPMAGNLPMNGNRVTDMADGSEATDAATVGQVRGAMPIGVVAPYAGTTAPSGWLLCYGQPISRSTYSDLFDAIGTTFGVGDGSTTFNLPDLRGRVVAGKDNMGGTSADRLTNQAGGLNGDNLGAAGGAETHTLTVAQMPSHNHGGTTGSGGVFAVRRFSELVAALLSGGGWSVWTGELDVASPSHTHSISSQGGGSAHNNVQPTLILNYIIKAAH